MPTYDYFCSQCSETIEIFQSMNDPDLTQCPTCSSTEIRKLISVGSGVIFKGSGFYVTDNRSKTSQD
ncbi:zinc ribbon domain-containing protein [Entomospira entomophila]|uniref:Zinc ribbon domain-containing protein n=1 Tax=Entomospira entomophila TaxID=2719988 RepID=A0A968GCM8_9SPIO|nr:zinc ribbon domain-containing protein [Entomospira entomophilus]NIZ40009.1 zinc ribbon domain-containing protein [Entomospira entomophilus]WDI35569.1 zinc ribbon domain-containing protein [Entomospira entomophilus]